MIVVPVNKPKDTLQLIIHESDIPLIQRGSLVPGAFTPAKLHGAQQKKRFKNQPTAAANRDALNNSRISSRVSKSPLQLGAPAPLLRLMSLLLLFGAVGLLSAYSYGAINQSQVAAPILAVVDPNTLSVTPLEYGPQHILQQENFYQETRAALIAGETTFLEIDLTREQLRYFVSGVLTESATITKAPTAGSWWEIPSGLYEVTRTETERFSNLAQATFPHTVVFGENLLLHGTPVYPNGQKVDAAFLGGGVRLDDLDAERLYTLIEQGTTVLVHTATKPRDAFVYEPPAPDISAPDYFVADLVTGAVLASSDADRVASVASITKLMTALVAAEELELDERVLITAPNFVQSLVPRLESRSSVSMYSLLQLLLVESSNEASEIIAGELGRDQFIAAMNTKARQIGMLNSNFADPSGLSSDNQSTVGDLFLLTQYIADNRSFIFDMTHDATIPAAYQGGDFSNLINFNEIEDVNGFVGGKVGETRAAGQTSISLHELEIGETIRTVVVIVLGSTGRTEDVQTLVQFVETQFSG